MPIQYPMKDLDPALVVYTLGGLFLVFGTFVILTILSEGVKSINARIREEEKKKKEEERARRAA